MNWVARSEVPPFWARLPDDLGSAEFRCDLRDALMREAFLTGRYEPQETALLQRLLRPGMTFVDVGANWGYFTLVGAHLVGSTGRVISVEADARACRALRANLDRNRVRTVQLHHVAASDAPGVLSFQEYDPAAADSGNFGVALGTSTVAGRPRVEVAARALDDLLDEARIAHVDVMKMDIEGGEARAIAGLGRRLGSQRIDYVSLELHPYHLRDLGTSAARVIAEMRGHGYRAWQIDHSRTAHRAAASARLDVAAMLTPLDQNLADLGDWPHVLWALEEPF